MPPSSFQHFHFLARGGPWGLCSEGRPRGQLYCCFTAGLGTILTRFCLSSFLMFLSSPFIFCMCSTWFGGNDTEQGVQHRASGNVGDIAPGCGSKSNSPSAMSLCRHAGQCVPSACAGHMWHQSQR